MITNGQAVLKNLFLLLILIRIILDVCHQKNSMSSDDKEFLKNVGCDQFTLSSSTSKINVEYGGMSCPAPRSP